MAVTNHNAYVMKSGDRICLITFLDASEIPELKNHGFVECVTQRNIYSNMLPYITINTDRLIDADDWSIQTIGMKCTGMGIAGIITQPLFYLRKMKSFLSHMIEPK